MSSRASGGTGRQATPRLARDRLFDPVHLVVPFAFVVLGIARHFGAIAPEPLWKLYGALVLAHIPITVVAALCAPGTERSRPNLFLGVCIGLGGVCLYVIGWGAVLAVNLLAGAVVLIQADGSRHGRTAIVCTLATILGGELGVAAGLFKSMIPEPQGHVLAALEAGITVTVLFLITRGQRDKEVAEAREKETEERFRALVQHASDAIIVVQDGGDVTYASPAVESILGCNADDLDRFDISWIDPDHATAIEEMFRELRKHPGAVEKRDVPMRRVDGSSRWVEVSVTNLTQNPVVAGYVCNMRDIGERRDAQQQLVHDANHDPVTQLPNRRFFLERLECLSSNTHDDELIAVLFIDVDHFKQVNDHYGHETGDQVLGAVATTLSTLVRSTDLVARFGGDEFTVLLGDGHDPATAFDVAERITAELSRPCIVGDGEIPLSVSVGIAVSRGREKTAEELLRHADQAMYHAKRSGRARWESFDVPRLQAS
jgi:diguanylate cyclase (GGDEF)-like protein/PAS domain S-box-containing protein